MSGPTWCRCGCNAYRPCSCSTKCPRSTHEDDDEEPAGAGYVTDEGRSIPTRDNFGTRPGVPSTPRSSR